jgi:hypothetical protein
LPQLVDALWGIESLPQDWVTDTLMANKEIYGIDIALLFFDSVYSTDKD